MRTQIYYYILQLLNKIYNRQKLLNIGAILYNLHKRRKTVPRERLYLPVFTLFSIEFVQSKVEGGRKFFQIILDFGRAAAFEFG